MNLKESFRLQSKLNAWFYSAQSSIRDSSHALNVTRNHLRSSVNKEDEDKIETVEQVDFIANDDMINFMVYLVNEKELLTKAINAAKNKCVEDLDSLIESNKLRQSLKSSIDFMLKFVDSKKIERGTAYKFDINSEQKPYHYDIEVISKENYNRISAKEIAKKLIKDADENSRKVDNAMVNESVDFDSIFDWNMSMEDAVAAYLTIA